MHVVPNRGACVLKLGRDRIYALVRAIPAGRVATYGQIAHLAGFPRHARQVGYAMAALERGDVPWHRVVNARGEISARATGDGAREQRTRLEREGVVFDAHGRIDLRRWQWRPDVRAGAGPGIPPDAPG